MTAGLTVTRTFAAPPERIWQAWTTPADFAQWFGTAAVEVPLDTLALDVRVGGTWSAVMHLPNGDRIDWVGEYREVEPPTRLVFTITDDPADPAREPVTVDIAPAPGGATMTLTQSGGNLTEAQYAQAAAGYNGFFDVMERLVTA